MPEPTDTVAKMDPYKVSESAKLSNDDKADYLKLDWNESAFPPSPEVSKALADVVEDGHFEYYPDVVASELREKLGQYTGLDSSYIQVFNGSDDALRTILDTYVDRDDIVLAREPVYTQPYTFIKTNGGERHTFTASSPFEKGLRDFKRELTDAEAQVVYIPNPNNPTGVCYSSTEVEELLTEFPDTLFVIDEAYYEFAETTVVDLVPNYKNLVVTRTFSKAFGLAGLRIGYVVAHRLVLDELEKVRNGKNVNLLGQIAAQAALNDQEYMRSKVEAVKETREWVVDELREMGFHVRSTPANYILIRVGDAEGVVESLKTQNILVRNRSDLPQLDGYIRVSVGTRKQMEQFVGSFSELRDELLDRNAPRQL